MEKGYWFTSDLFEILKDEDAETNPGCYGKALGNWLCGKFRDLGYDVEELIAEDWGWCVMCHARHYVLWVGCVSVISDNFQDRYDPDAPPDGKDVVWHVFPVVEVPFFRVISWLKKITGKLDTKSPLKKLNEQLKVILEQEPRIVICDEP